VTIDAFRQKAFPAALASPGENGAAAFGPHPGAKSVLTFASSL